MVVNNRLEFNKIVLTCIVNAGHNVKLFTVGFFISVAVGKECSAVLFAQLSQYSCKASVIVAGNFVVGVVASFVGVGVVGVRTANQRAYQNVSVYCWLA